jgi:hypothetical protein
MVRCGGVPLGATNCTIPSTNAAMTAKACSGIVPPGGLQQRCEAHGRALQNGGVRAGSLSEILHANINNTASGRAAGGADRNASEGSFHLNAARSCAGTSGRRAGANARSHKRIFLQACICRPNALP